MSAFISIVRLIRPVNCLMAAICVPVGAYMTLEPLVWPPLVLVATAIFCICAAGNIFNDIRDLEIDRIAHPARILASSRLSVSIARRIGMALNGLGAILSFGAGVPAAVAVWVMIGLLFAYNNYLRRVPLLGNVVVALLAGSVFMIGGVVIGPPVVFELPGPIIPALFAFLVHLMREIVKDAQDMEADRKHGLRTLPMVIGVRGSLYCAAILAIILGLAIYWPYREEWFGRKYMLVAGIGVILPVAVALSYVLAKPAVSRMPVLCTTLKVSMGVGIVALLLA
jgi:geranylgeranylglycerol-phosphate geranylgeranyltransferase